jgi:hypothetical protein
MKPQCSPIVGAGRGRYKYRARNESPAQMTTINECRYRWLRPPILTYDVLAPQDRAPRRAQLSIRRDRRNYDPSIAGLGTDKAQRYFASDFDRLSLVRRYRDRSGRSRSRQRATTAVLYGPSRYGKAVLAREKVDVG